MRNFKISIPKPCHKDWNTMTPNEKGRFCSSCSKTVVDFTKKSAGEIQDYFIENKGKHICGHFRRKQLDSIVIQIPETIFSNQLSFQKLFILALLFVMGTTLFSCKNDKEESQKIEKVELIDTIVEAEKIIDSVKLDIITKPIIKPSNLSNIVESGGIKVVEEPLMGLPIAVEYEDHLGEPVVEEISLILFNFVDIPPRFKETRLKSKEKLKDIFNKKLNHFMVKNLGKDIGSGLGLSKGKHKMFTQFTIDEKGNVSDLKVRAPHQKLKDTLISLIKKLPQFIPGKQNDKNVAVKYTLPITFIVE